jgi:hypothetical protein
MVVVCPPPSMYMAPPAIDYSVIVSGDDGSSYYVLEPSENLRITSTSGDLIIEVEEDEEDDDDDGSSIDAGDEPCWDPLQHIDELPLRPMSPLRKACIDVSGSQHPN